MPLLVILPAGLGSVGSKCTRSTPTDHHSSCIVDLRTTVTGISLAAGAPMAHIAALALMAVTLSSNIWQNSQGDPRAEHVQWPTVERDADEGLLGAVRVTGAAIRSGRIGRVIVLSRWSGAR